jgi:hypothetical protein
MLYPKQNRQQLVQFIRWNLDAVTQSNSTLFNSQRIQPTIPEADCSIAANADSSMRQSQSAAKGALSLPRFLDRRLVLVDLSTLGLLREQRDSHFLRTCHVPARSAVYSILDISGKSCQQVSERLSEWSLTFHKKSRTKSRSATAKENTPMTNGISWPVVLMVLTPEIPATRMVLSTKRIKQAIAVRVSTCA